MESSRLQKLLTYSNPHLPEYLERAKFQRRMLEVYQGRRSAIWNAYFKDTITMGEFPRATAYLASKLKGKTLLDLGCGEFVSRKEMEKLAKAFGVAHYIGNDFRYLLLEEGEQEGCKPVELEFHLEDMLTFVARLKEGCANFVVNDLGRELFLEPDSYNRALAKEIARATEIGGIVMGSFSEVFGQLLEFGFRIVDGLDIKNDRATFIMEKS